MVSGRKGSVPWRMSAVASLDTTTKPPLTLISHHQPHLVVFFASLWASGRALRPGRTGFLMHRNLIRAQSLALGISTVGVYPTEY